ncbi:alpha/beta hydrolase [Nocardia sp. NPDC050710]|uniref:alpha/beta fold hydrolase n=1 Tax=Nocardia sp. NPDC050710 TaxID=3157220 RepID=UPI0033E003F2
MEIAVSKDGTRLAYDVVGAGPALVYITGATCFRKFRPILGDVKVFGTKFSVYNYDRRGRGDSGDTAPYAVERELEDIEAIIDAAGGKAHLYGHSSGAVLALEAALRMPDKVDRVVIYDAPYVHDETERRSYRELAEKVAGLLSDEQNGRALKVFLRGIGMPAPFVALLPAFPGWKSMKALAPTLRYDIGLTEEVPPLDRLAKIDVPVCISVGAKNPVGLHHVAEQLAKTIPHSTHRVIDGQDHMVSAKVLLPVLEEHLTAR